MDLEPFGKRNAKIFASIGNHRMNDRRKGIPSSAVVKLDMSELPSGQEESVSADAFLQFESVEKECYKDDSTTSASFPNKKIYGVESAPVSSPNQGVYSKGTASTSSLQSYDRDQLNQEASGIGRGMYGSSSVLKSHDLGQVEFDVCRSVKGMSVSGSKQKQYDVDTQFIPAKVGLGRGYPSCAMDREVSARGIYGSTSNEAIIGRGSVNRISSMDQKKRGMSNSAEVVGRVKSVPLSVSTQGLERSETTASMSRHAQLNKGVSASPPTHEVVGRRIRGSLIYTGVPEEPINISASRDYDMFGRARMSNEFSWDQKIGTIKETISPPTLNQEGRGRGRLKAPLGTNQDKSNSDEEVLVYYKRKEAGGRGKLRSSSYRGE